MKKLTFILALCSLAYIVNAQSLDRQVIASGGDFFENSSVGSLSWTLGEPVVETVENGSVNIILTQGFQQPVDYPVGVPEVYANDISVQVYPNPAVNNVRLDITYDKNSRLGIELIDMWGRVITADGMDVMRDQQTYYQLDVSTLASGMYLVRITDDGELLNTYKIQKVGY